MSGINTHYYILDYFSGREQQFFGSSIPAQDFVPKNY